MSTTPREGGTFSALHGSRYCQTWLSVGQGVLVQQGLTALSNTLLDTSPAAAEVSSPIQDSPLEMDPGKEPSTSVHGDNGMLSFNPTSNLNQAPATDNNSLVSPNNQNSIT